MEKESQIKRIIQKDQCLDIFKDAQDGTDHLTKSMNHQQFMKYKFEKKSRELVLSKLKIMMDSRGLSRASRQLSRLVRRQQLQRNVRQAGLGDPTGETQMQLATRSG